MEAVGCFVMIACNTAATDVHLLSGRWRRRVAENSFWSSLNRLLKVSNRTEPKWVFPTCLVSFLLHQVRVVHCR